MPYEKMALRQVALRLRSAEILAEKLLESHCGMVCHIVTVFSRALHVYLCHIIIFLFHLQQAS